MGCGIITRLAEEAGISPGVNVLEDVSKDFAGAGVSAKVTPLKAGQKVIQHKHAYPHLSVLLSGSVLLETDDSKVLLVATLQPKSIVIEAGKYHAVTALKDSVWLCIHLEGKV